MKSLFMILVLFCEVALGHDDQASGGKERDVLPGGAAECTASAYIDVSWSPDLAILRLTVDSKTKEVKKEPVTYTKSVASWKECYQFAVEAAAKLPAEGKRVLKGAFNRSPKAHKGPVYVYWTFNGVTGNVNRLSGSTPKLGNALGTGRELASVQ